MNSAIVVQCFLKNVVNQSRETRKRVHNLWWHEPREESIALSDRNSLHIDGLKIHIINLIWRADNWKKNMLLNLFAIARGWARQRAGKMTRTTHLMDSNCMPLDYGELSLSAGRRETRNYSSWIEKRLIFALEGSKEIIIRRAPSLLNCCWVWRELQLVQSMPRLMWSQPQTTEREEEKHSLITSRSLELWSFISWAGFFTSRCLQFTSRCI